LHEKRLRAQIAEVQIEGNEAMERKLTHLDTLDLQDVVRIGDLLLLPKGRLPNLSESFVLQSAGVIDVNTSETARNQLWRDLLSMEHSYNSSKYEDGEEPGWVENLPIHVRAYLRYSYAIREEDPLRIVGFVPHTGLSYMFVADGLADATHRLFKLGRLQGIQQLGFLQPPWVAMSDQQFVLPLTHVNRYLHSMDVMALSMTMADKLGLPEKERNTVQVAGFTHDWGMPAGGDSVKLVDVEALDEDRNYKRLIRERLDQRTWERVQHEYGIDENTLVRTIQNEGILGQILDVADKLAYVARDIDTCLNVAVGMRHARLDDSDAYVGTRALTEIVKDHSHVCSVWDSVRSDQERLVFTDVQRLIAFLKVRIVLFRELYYHPRARFGEYLISRILVKKLYDRGELTREMLLEMNDRELHDILDKRYGQRMVIRALSLKSNVQSFATREEALAFKADLDRFGVPFSLVEDHLHSIKPGTHFLVDSPAGVMPFLQAYRGDVRELHEMATMLPAVHVYYLAKEEMDAGDRQEVFDFLTA